MARPIFDVDSGVCPRCVISSTYFICPNNITMCVWLKRARINDRRYGQAGWYFVRGGFERDQSTF